MSTETYLALFRKIEDSFVYQDSGLLHIWIHCLIKASFKDRIIMFDGAEISLKRGQFITGRKSLAKTLKTTEQKIRSRLALLEKHNQISQKSTNRYSIITVVKYDHYQTEPKKITSRQPADNQLITTNNKVNKVNKDLGDKPPEKTNPLLNKKEDMSWNAKAEDYEEGVIDLEGDTTLIEIKKRPTKKYPNAPAIRKLFQEVLGRNPANWLMNKTQLQACENLYTERTLEKVRIALEFYKENKDKEFCPIINSPYDLDSKWTNLGDFKLKL